MLHALRKIAKGYQTSDQIRRNSEKEYGLEFSEALEYSYDNLQNEAKTACQGIRFIEDKSWKNFLFRLLVWVIFYTLESDNFYVWKNKN